MTPLQHLTVTLVRSGIARGSCAAVILTFALCVAEARAQSLCPSVDQGWLGRVAAGEPVSYGFAVDGVIQQSGKKTAGGGEALSSIGVIKLLGTSFQSDGGAALISGTASGTETQNVGGDVTTVSFEDATSSFTIDTRTCTGTVTRTLSNDEVVVWRIVLVDGENTIRFIDTRGNPALRTGVLEMMR